MSEVAAILDSFRIADKTLLAKRALLKRVDTKFLLPEGQLGAILAPLGEEYGIVLAGDKRLATYRTVYYDTPEKVCFHDHRRGRRPRQKVRIRHYDDRNVSFLEIKTKRSAYLSVKKRRPLEFGDSTLDDDGREFVGENTRLDESELKPSVHTDFQRATLVGYQVNERITIDVNLVVSNAGGTDPIALKGIAILEVKQRQFSIRSPIMGALRAAGVRPASASKYCTATALLEPGLRRNRLLPALRAIERLRQ